MTAVADGGASLPRRYPEPLPKEPAEVGLVGEAGFVGDFADPAIRVSRITQGGQASPQPPAADVGPHPADILELPVKLAARDTQIPGDRVRREIVTMEVLFDVAAQALPDASAWAGMRRRYGRGETGRQEFWYRA